MFRKTLAFVVMLSVVNALNVASAIGIVKVDEHQLVLSSASQWPEGAHASIYRVGTWDRSTIVVVGKGKLVANSTLYNAYGENKSWDYRARPSKKLPKNTIWLSVPTNWVVIPIDADHLKIKVGKERQGILTISKGEEGINIDIEIGDYKDHLYYYLGYDII